jgi:type II secretory pathway component PulF
MELQSVRRGGGSAVIVVVAHTALWCIFFWALISRVPIYEQRFRDFQIKLPFYCEPVIALSHVVQAYFYLLMLPFAPLLVLDGVMYLFFRRRGRAWGALWALMLFLPPLFASAWVFFGLFLAEVKLMESLSR